MANPQKENGFTSIANELLEAIYKSPFNGTQMRIIMCVIRSTYGHQKKSHEISISYLLKALDMTKGQYKQVKREVDTMIKNCVLNEEKKPTKSTARIISLNKNYDQWFKNTSSLNRPLVESDHSTSGLIRPVKKKDIKKLYSDKVYLKDSEYEKICSRLGELNADEYIERLNDYLVRNPKKEYSSHYLTIINWYKKDNKDNEKSDNDNLVNFPVKDVKIGVPKGVKLI